MAGAQLKRKVASVENHKRIRASRIQHDVELAGSTRWAGEVL